MPPPTHVTFVGAWLERAAAGRSPRQLIELTELALNALCASARKTLGEITLIAIVDRVLHEAAERHPFLSELTVESSQISCKRSLRPEELPSAASALDGLRGVLVEFLTVMGNLTAEILTPALHGALSGALSQLADATQAQSEGRGPGEAEDT